jgi:hypothetical protein
MSKPYEEPTELIKNELKRRELKKQIITKAPSSEGFLLYVGMIYEYYYKAPFIRAWWHEIIALMLLDVLAGKISYLIITFAPRHRKTDLVIRMFATYALGMSRSSKDVKNALKLIYATYGGVLSAKTSSEAKAIVESEIYKYIFPQVKIKKDTDQKTDWALEGNATFFATSVQGTGTGVGADIYFVDDPIKASEEGSLLVRDAVWDFWTGSVVTRLEGIKASVYVMQRVHEDDLVGRLKKWLKEKDMLKKMVELNIPALNREETIELPPHTVDYHYEATENIAFINSTKENMRFRKSLTTDCVFLMRSKEFIHINKGEEVFISHSASYELELRVSFEETYTYKDYTVIRPPYTPLDENLFNIEELEDKRKDAYTWQTQYLQDPKPSKVGFFKEEWQQWLFPHEVDEGARYAFVDPAESQNPKADNRAIAMVRKLETYDKTVKTFVEDGRCGLWDIYEFCQHIFNFGLIYPDTPFYIELAGGGITLSTVLPQELLKFNASQQAKGLPQFSNAINWVKVDNQVSKNTIINLMQFPLSQHQLVFNTLMDETFKTQLKKELNAYNPDKTDNDDDCMDCISKSFFNRECSPKSHTIKITSSVRKKHSNKTNKKRWKF